MIFILFFLFFSVIYAMTTPFTTLASPASWVVNTKYLANSKQESFSERFEKEVLLGQLRVEKSTIQLDGDNFELHYKVLNQGDDVTLSHFEMELDINLDNQVMMAEGFQCWSTTREVDRYSRMAAIPGPVAWFTKFNLQG
jgi:alpha-galactosidase